jgi:hypothetical protein
MSSNSYVSAIVLSVITEYYSEHDPHFVGSRFRHRFRLGRAHVRRTLFRRLPLMTKSSCTSRPNCPCPFCQRARTEPSARDEQDQLVNEYVSEYIGESLREWWIAGQRKDARLAMAARVNNFDTHDPGIY